MTPPIFRWETLRVANRHMLPLKEPVHGVTMEVELLTGSRVRVFRADDREFYFCHGLTFGSVSAPGGAVSPYSDVSVKTILKEFFVEVSEPDAIAQDVVVWWNVDGNPDHSAILLKPVHVKRAGQLAYESVLRSKNGSHPVSDMSLGQLSAEPNSYGESYRVYRYRSVEE